MNEKTVCYVAHHVLQGWRRQQSMTGGPEDRLSQRALEAYLFEALVGDEPGCDRALRLCKGVVAAEWQNGHHTVAQKVSAALTGSDLLISKRRFTHVFRQMDKHFDALYRATRLSEDES